MLEFDYFGEDEDVLNSLLERELAPVVQNGNTSARGREQSAPSTTGTKKESAFNNNNNNNNVLKHIFSLLDQDGGGKLSLYEFKKGATDVLGVKIDRKILEPYFPIRRSSEHQNNEQQKDTNTNNKIDSRAFQEGVVEYDTFEKICSEWMEREEATKGVLNRKYNSFS